MDGKLKLDRSHSPCAFGNALKKDILNLDLLKKNAFFKTMSSMMLQSFKSQLEFGEVAAKFESRTSKLRFCVASLHTVCGLGETVIFYKGGKGLFPFDSEAYIKMCLKQEDESHSREKIK